MINRSSNPSSRKSQNGISIGSVVLTLVLASGGFIGWKAWQGYTKRAEQAKEAAAAQISIKQIQVLAGQYDDQIKLAASTSRMALSGPVERLQTTRRQLQGLVVPACLERSKGLASQAMDAGVNIFLDFMQQKTSDEESGVRAERMGKQFGEAAEAFNDCPKMPTT